MSTPVDEDPRRLTDADRERIREFLNATHPHPDLIRDVDWDRQTRPITRSQCRQFRARAYDGDDAKIIADRHECVPATVRQHIRGECSHDGVGMPPGGWDSHHRIYRADPDAADGEWPACPECGSTNLHRGHPDIAFGCRECAAKFHAHEVME